MTINNIDLAYSWMDTERPSVVQDVLRLGSVEKAAEYNQSLYLDEVGDDDNAAELEVEDFVEALREIIERKGDDIWVSLTSTIYLVLDEVGVNMADAQVRKFGDVWLYVDSMDGFEILEDVKDFILRPVDED